MNREGENKKHGQDEAGDFTCERKMKKKGSRQTHGKDVREREAGRNYKVKKDRGYKFK